ncbi:hypothetical protein QYE76_013232 [Lolium multiflorum]|uniref:Uncharacterized protein n=1 Tax=Lolium multiflorum TaxID=4521 RepID=A0AAD8TYH1_LOLMU|nr:hypothetical protein QYE76_013232 [Lolium multiflorum]
MHQRILYRGEYENLNECPVCTALRYKIRGDDPGDDVEGQKPGKKIPAKVMWVGAINTPLVFSRDLARLSCPPSGCRLAVRSASPQRRRRRPRRAISTSSPPSGLSSPQTYVRAPAALPVARASPKVVGAAALAREREEMAVCSPARRSAA